MKCESCKTVARLKEQIETLENSKRSDERLHDFELGIVVKRDTDIINGLMREIEALYLLLEKQSQNGDEQSEDGGAHIHNSQNMRF